MVNLIRSSISGGLWRGEFEGFADAPAVVVLHLGTPLDDVSTLQLESGNWEVSVPIPSSVLTDGVLTFVVQDQNDKTLATFTIIAGEPFAEDLRAEINLLREELDLIKSAFRRHVSETT